MTELPPEAMAALIEQAPSMGELGAFFLECFGDFDFSGIELLLPEETFNGEMSMDVGDRRLELIEVGPAHTRGDTLVYDRAGRVLFSGDILFCGATRSPGRSRLQLDSRMRADPRDGRRCDRARARTARGTP